MDTEALNNDFLIMIPNHLCDATEFQALPIRVLRDSNENSMTILVSDKFVKPASEEGQKIHIVSTELFTKMVSDIQIFTEAMKHKATQTSTWSPSYPTLGRSVVRPRRYRPETKDVSTQTISQFTTEQ